MTDYGDKMSPEVSAELDKRILRFWRMKKAEESMSPRIKHLGLYILQHGVIARPNDLFGQPSRAMSRAVFTRFREDTAKYYNHPVKRR